MDIQPTQSDPLRLLQSCSITSGIGVESDVSVSKCASNWQQNIMDH
jgi:hypothetical protein